MISPEVLSLKKALSELENRLMSASVRDPGFAEIHAVFWSLNDELIRVANEDIATVRSRMNETAERIVAEWESSKESLAPWNDVLSVVSNALGVVLQAGKLQNPLTLLL